MAGRWSDFFPAGGVSSAGRPAANSIVKSNGSRGEPSDARRGASFGLLPHLDAAVVLEPLEEDNEDASKLRGTMCCGLMGQPVPRDWASAMQTVWWYRVSSFAYCIPGSLAAVRPEPLLQHASPCCMHFPFRSIGIAVTLNGLISYLSDVVYLGNANNPCKKIDVVLAASNTVVQVLIAILQIGGFMSFPRIVGSVFAMSIVAALYSKRRSAIAVRDRDISACTFWHAMWHYTLPCGALIAQMLLPFDKASAAPLPWYSSLKEGL